MEDKEGKGLIDFFENFLERKTLFKDRHVLQSQFTPDKIFHRDEQIQQLAQIIAPLLRCEKPSNVFIYGKTGTGKTVTVKFVTQQINKICEEKDIPVKIIYLNCKLKKVADTEYRLIAQLAREFGKAIPPTGLPTDEVYNAFYSVIDQKKQQILFILDEVDQLVNKIGNEILYNLTRMNSELKNAQVSIIGISNDVVFSDILDPRVKSSLSEEEIIFPPYNATQIQVILRQRAEKSFHKEILDEGVIEKCAAYAARDHGDVRRALELLRVSGEIAEREAAEKVKIEHLDKAEDKIEKDRIIDIITTQPKQYQLVLYSILNIHENKLKQNLPGSQHNKKELIFTGEIYDFYQKICDQAKLRPLTQRRISDIIAEFDMLGLIQAKTISKGRYGRTREIILNDLTWNDKVKNTLLEQLSL